jgi:ATP-dependent Lhr-like helicase
MEAIRAGFPWLNGDGDNVLVSSASEVTWWTFAGGRVNLALAHELAQKLAMRVTSDNFAVRFPPDQGLDVAEPALRDLCATDPARIVPPVSEPALVGLKFSECLPPDLAARVVRARLSDSRGVAEVLGRATRSVVAG